MFEIRKGVQQFYLYLKKKLSVKIIFTIGLIIVSCIFFIYHKDQIPKTKVEMHKAVASEISNVSQQTSIALITEPDDGISDIKNVINKASKSLDLVMYELEDKDIEQEIVDAKNRGVDVKVIMQNMKEFGSSPNQDAYDFFEQNKVPVKWAPDYFYLTHQKTLIVDGTSAVIMTFNLTPRYYSTSRDFAVVDNDLDDVAAISSAFNSDWSGQEQILSSGKDLVWSPGSADTLLSLINSASVSIDVYNEEMADPRIIDALEKAASRKISVRIDMTYETEWKEAFNNLVSAGVAVNNYSSSAKFYIHAKGIFVDNKIAFLGSENFSEPSLDSNRELGILISNPEIVSSLENTFEKDWTGTHPFVISLQATSAETSFIKLSKSGICHTPEDASYNQTKNFTAYDTIEECLAAGGRLPANAK